MSNGKLMAVYGNAFFSGKPGRPQHQLALTEAAHHTATPNQVSTTNANSTAAPLAAATL